MNVCFYVFEEKRSTCVSAEQVTHALVILTVRFDYNHRCKTTIFRGKGLKYRSEDYCSTVVLPYVQL